jgi:hypothetical protein
MSKLLVTGRAGYISSILVGDLLREGYEDEIYSRRTR